MSIAASASLQLRLRQALRRWPAAASGVAAVEFAMVLPVMVAMLLGMTEVTTGVNIDRKLTLLARSLADLASRVPQISTSDMSDMFSAAGAVIQPYSATNTQMVLSSIKVTKVGSVYTGTVQWSCGKNIPASGTGNLAARTIGSTYTVPSGFTSSSSFILAETLSPYTPAFGAVITGTIKLVETTPWPVRNVDYVTLSGSCPT